MKKILTILFLFLSTISPLFAYHGMMGRDIKIQDIEPQSMTIEDIFNFNFFKYRKWEEDEYYKADFVDMSIYNREDPNYLYYKDGKYYNKDNKEINPKTKEVITEFDGYTFIIRPPKNMPEGMSKFDLHFLVNGEGALFDGNIFVHKKENNIEIYYEKDGGEKEYLVNGIYDVTQILNSEWLYNGITKTIKQQEKDKENEEENGKKYIDQEVPQGDSSLKNENILKYTLASIIAIFCFITGWYYIRKPTLKKDDKK